MRLMTKPLRRTALFIFALAFASPASAAAPPSTPHDGQHDFDFDLGIWKTHTSRLDRPLTGSTTWSEMDGYTVVRKLWDGRANLAELESDGPKGHLSLISLRLYDPRARQWRLYFATADVGVLSVPMVGEFKDGRGEFTDQERVGDRTIWVRFTFTSISPDSARSEQAFSDDGGKTWETNWVNQYTRVAALPEAAAASARRAHAAQAGSRDFDFNVGVWKNRIKRFVDPLAGSAATIELAGTVTVNRVWDGLAQIEEIEADGPNGHWEGLTLFLFDPKARQWSQLFANSKKGTMEPPLIGSFKGGRGELVSQDTVGGRSILVRSVWSDITDNAHHYEESYSDDLGRTWKPAFVVTLTRDTP